MDAKEIKTTLKSAREAIKKKEFKEALRLCKTILEVDRNNYMALVLIAVSAEGLEQKEQALKAYKRAIESDNELSLAWQGLCSFYEKNRQPKYESELITVYLKLAELYSSEREKKLDIIMKLADSMTTVTSTETLDKVITIYEQFAAEEQDRNNKVTVQEKLITLLKRSQLPDRDTKFLRLCEDILRHTDTLDSQRAEDFIALYLATLTKMKEISMQAKIDELYKLYPESPLLLRYGIFCRLDSCVGRITPLLNDTLEEMVTKLTSLVPDLLSGVLGYIALCHKDYIGARDQLQTGVDQSPSMVSYYYFLSLTQLRLHDNSAAIATCEKGLRVLQQKTREFTGSSITAARSFHHVQVLAWLGQGTGHTLQSAVESIEKNLSDLETDDLLTLKGLVLLKQGQVESAEKCIVGPGVPGLDLLGRIAFVRGDYQLACDKFEAALELEPENAGCLLRLAKCHWEVGKRRRECFPLLLKAAKLDPYYSETFLYLGHYYSQAVGDTTRAQKCYQKSFDLDTDNAEAGVALCDLLTSVGQEDKAHDIVIMVTDRASAGSAKWAWLRLGLYQVKREDPIIATASFQAALRADPSDNHVWECLAEAYYHRGSLTAALKAFTRASELDADSMYCLFQMANIKQTLGMYSEAVQEYQTILDRSPSYVPALKGLGETYLLQCRSLLSKYFHGRARDTAELSVRHLTRAIGHRPDLSCLWKVMGDACTVLHVLPEMEFKFHVLSKLVGSSEGETATISKLETLQLGGRCYGKALQILPECSSLWHDLGVNYFHQSRCSSSDSAISLAEKAAQCLKKAIQFEPTNHKHWTALGHVACFEGYYRPDLAQHCFIKSVEVEANNVVAWTNLAALYLKNNNVQLAHEAFKIAQSLEPSYVACWIGQAIIAEIVGHDDAMDLFRHTTELGNHVESAIGYGHWVCMMLQKGDKHGSEMYRYAIEQMAAIPAASDALARFTDRVKTNAVAYNMHGLLLEHQKLYKTSAEAFSRALQVMGDDEVSVQREVQCNYARVLCKSGNYEKSAEIFEGLFDQLDSFPDVCQMGLAFYKTNKLKLSFRAYSKAAELTSLDAEKSHVFAALGMVTYKFGDLDEAKTTLFQSSQMSEPSSWGLQALCALGLLQSDVTLATAVMSELSKLGDTNGCVADVMVLAVTLSIMQGNKSEAKRQIQRLLHKDPTQPKLWGVLSSVLLRYFPDLGHAIASTARCAVELDTQKTMCGYDLISAGQLHAGYHSNTDTTNNALMSAQRLVHLYPDKLDHWAELASAVHAEAILSRDERRSALLADEQLILNFVLKHDHLSLAMKLWCHKQLVVCTLHSGRNSDTLSGLEMMLAEFGNDSDASTFFEVFKNVMQNDRDGLSSVVTRTSHLYYWQILAEMYVRAGLTQEVELLLKQCLQSTEGSSTRQVQYMTLMKLAYSMFQQIVTGESSDQMLALFNEAVEQVLLIDPDSAPIYLMKGILNLGENKRIAKHYLQRVTEGHVTGNRGHDLSLARQGLVYLLHSGKKDGDILRKVVSDATRCKDTATILYYERMTGDSVQLSETCTDEHS